MRTLKVYKCFISSPGDCSVERESCEKIVDDINLGLATHLGIRLETFMWENDVLQDIGKNPQDIIDPFIKASQYDVFIGIMKNRFGTPTQKFGSGTEHEFKDALLRKNKSTDSIPRILFFFGKEPVDPDNFDFEQYAKVKEFKAKISYNGLYTDFISLDNFKDKLKNQLELFLQEQSPLDSPSDKIKEVDVILKRMESDLNESLKTYNEKSPLWIEPIISTKREVPNTPNKNKENQIKIDLIINDPQDLIIKAPSEFGLTSLAHFLKQEAWKNGKVFLYIDTKMTKRHKVLKDIKREAEAYFFKNMTDIDCILLDSVCFEESGKMQLLKNVCEEFIDIPIVIFNTLDNNFFLKSTDDDKVKISRNFTSYYLLPLPQNEVRKLVVSYSRIKSLKENHDVILSKVTKDLEILNMHRTAKNCISILKATSKIGSDYSPVNRTKLLETILTTIFEEYEIPTYHDKKPDVKDCSFVLGYFCELLLLRNDFEFTRDFFKREIKQFCEENFIELDVNYLLQVLIDNSIFSENASESKLYFRNSYWVFYFIAQRMNMNNEFLNSVYEGKKYIDFPEIIEFYTGIDRNKEDALNILNSDLKETLKDVRSKVNLPSDLNPYRAIKWNPKKEALEKIEANIGKNILSSGLPDEVKDKYDDKNYNQIRPYNQVISSVIREYSFLILMRQITATSRALRNSDFVKPAIKKELLDNIIQAWNEISKLLIALSPLLADRGSIAFQGAYFILDEEGFRFTNPIEKRKAVLLAVPTNVVKIFKDDLFSSKMGPLIISKANNEANSLLKHELMLLIIAERPRGWRNVIDSYVINLDRDSYFLSGVLTALEFNKNYNAINVKDRKILSLLAKKCIAKHKFKKDNPGLGLIKKIK